MKPLRIEEEDFLVLNVSGFRYQLHRGMLHRFPGCLLDCLLSATDIEIANLGSSDKNKKLDNGLTGIHRTSDKLNRCGYCPFIPRSPKMFELIVLNTYVTGKLHIPKRMCPKSVLDELKFWRLDIDRKACFCCAVEETESLENGNDVEKLTQLESLQQTPAWHQTSKWKRFQSRMWDFCDKPSTSIAATIFSIFSLTFVILYIAVFVANSVIYKELCLNETVLFTDNGTDIYQNTTPFLVKNIVLSLNASQRRQDEFELAEGDNSATEDVLSFVSNCSVTQSLQILETICIAWFTLELLLRLVACPSWSVFFKNPLNIIDILSTVPYYIEVALVYLEYYTPHVKRLHEVFVIIRVLRCLCVLRILKLALYFEELRILGKTFKSAKDELYMLGLFVFIAVFIFSSVMYQLEKDEIDTQYTSIPASCWWGIVTLTTVGYGDMFPKTAGGKALTSIACVTGIIITAFPISVLVEHFTLAYKNKSKSTPIFQLRLPKMTSKDIPKKPLRKRTSI